MLDWLLALVVYASKAELPPCPTEDSISACYWDADVRGNGEGLSFTVTKSGAVIYWPDGS